MPKKKHQHLVLESSTVLPVDLPVTVVDQAALDQAAAELKAKTQEEIDRQLALQTAEHVERMKSHCKRITDRLKAMGFTPELTPGALWEIMSQENLGFIIKWVVQRPGE
jgi:hypothetical protein